MVTVRTYWAWGNYCYVASARRRTRRWGAHGGGERYGGIPCRHVHNLLTLVLFLLMCQEPSEVRNDATMRYCCWPSGRVSATLRLSKRCFVPGETIFINADIVNNSYTDITRTHAAIKQVC